MRAFTPPFRATPPPTLTTTTPRCALRHPHTRALRRRVLATDLDGTLLTTSKNIHPANAAAVLQALSEGLVFLPATGKSPSGAFRAMGAVGDHLSRNGLLQGVFLNGLLVRSNRGVIYERFLCHPAVSTVVSYAEAHGLVPLFYRRDSLLVKERNRFTDLFIVSHEPLPTEIGCFHAMGAVNKALLVDPRGRVTNFRRELETLLDGVAVITQAREDVLEVMPKGVSKATGLDMLLEELGFGRADVVAVGDNENDVEMIRMAGLGVAVGNAVPRLLHVADELVCGCDDAAIAEVLERFVL